MFKKLSVVIAITALSACAQLSSSGYKITDEEVKNYIIEQNKMEQCIHPEITKANNDPDKLKKIYSSWSEEEHYLWHSIMSSTMIGIIGPENHRKIAQDSKSRQYFNAKFEKFNHSHPVIFTEQEKEECKLFKQNFNKQLNELKSLTK